MLIREEGRGVERGETGLTKVIQVIVRALWTLSRKKAGNLRELSVVSQLGLGQGVKSGTRRLTRFGRRFRRLAYVVRGGP